MQGGAGNPIFNSRIISQTVCGTMRATEDVSITDTWNKKKHVFSCRDSISASIPVLIGLGLTVSQTWPRCAWVSRGLSRSGWYWIWIIFETRACRLLLKREVIGHCRAAIYNRNGNVNHEVFTRNNRGLNFLKSEPSGLSKLRIIKLPRSGISRARSGIG